MCSRGFDEFGTTTKLQTKEIDMSYFTIHTSETANPAARPVLDGLARMTRTPHSASITRAHTCATGATSSRDQRRNVTMLKARMPAQ